MLNRYITLAEQESKVTFAGRLATYRYLDMDTTIAEALNVAAMYEKALSEGTAMPAFAADIR